MSLLTRVDLFAAQVHFVNACAASRQHSAITAEAFKRYGDHGPQISGCIRDHFPESVKDQLRALARTVSEESDIAWKCKPPRVRASTMRALGRSVAQRHGSGFYGPQP